MNCFQKLYLCILSKADNLQYALATVVNCFQNCILLYSRQQFSGNLSAEVVVRELLSKLYLLYSNNNFWFPVPDPNQRCELLSKIVPLISMTTSNVVCRCIGNVVNCFQRLFYRSSDNLLNSENFNQSVVNCFQNCIFYIVLDNCQRLARAAGPVVELLSKLYFWYRSLNNAMKRPCQDQKVVVNCFQKFVPLISVLDNLQGLLKIYSARCELLSKLYLLYGLRQLLWSALSAT